MVPRVIDIAELFPDSLPEPSQVKVDLTQPVQGITADCRQVQPGWIFYAIRGTKVDGHSYIETALKKEAGAIVVEDPKAFQAFEKTIRVDSTRRHLSLGAAAFFGHPSKALTSVIGITGTNGKTTVSHLIDELLRKESHNTALLGTITYRIGQEQKPAPLTTPDGPTLQGLFSKMREAQVTHATMEVSSIALDQGRTLGTHFDVGIFTNLTEDHLDYHKTMENYYQAKKQFFTDHPMKHALINIDDPWGKRLTEELPGAQTFSLADPGAHFYIEDLRLSLEGAEGTFKARGKSYPFEIPLLGRHNVANALAALSALILAEANETNETKIQSYLRTLKQSPGAPGRLELVKLKTSPTQKIYVDYAHTPDALQNVAQLLREVSPKKTKLITVFGCGGDRDRTKRPAMAKAASQSSQITIATSDNPRTENPNQILNDLEPGITPTTQYHRQPDRKKAIHLALNLAEPDDIILIAGKGHEPYQILGTEKIPFDDREVIRSFDA